MDTSSQFVLIAKRILRELRILNQAVSALLLRIQEQTETIAKEQHTKNKCEKTLPVLRAELQIPQSIKSDWERENAKKVRREWFAIGLGTATLLAVVAYAIINYHMLRQMTREADAAARTAKVAEGQLAIAQQSLGTTIESFHLEQRAWISVASIQLSPPTPSEPIFIRIDVMNTGKTPAIITTAKYNIRISPTAIKEFPEVSYQLISMGAIATPGIPIAAWCGGHKLAEAEVDAIKTGGAFVYIDGYFNYRDVFKRDHNTGYCALYNFKSGSFSQPPECAPKNYAN